MLSTSIPVSSSLNILVIISLNYLSVKLLTSISLRFSLEFFLVPSFGTYSLVFSVSTNELDGIAMSPGLEKEISVDCVLNSFCLLVVVGANACAASCVTWSEGVGSRWGSFACVPLPF